MPGEEVRAERETETRDTAPGRGLSVLSTPGFADYALIDSGNGRMVLDLLLAMNREEGTTMVLVTHEAELAARADRRILLRDGRIESA